MQASEARVMSYPRYSPSNSKAIYSKKFKVRLPGRITTMAIAEEEGLIRVFHDRHLGVYSYIINQTGEVFSYFLGFAKESWPDWLKEHEEKRDALAGSSHR